MSCTVVCYSTGDWDATLWTNKQHLMSRLATAGCRILYVDSLGLRRPSLNQDDVGRMAQRIRNWRPTAKRIADHLWRDSPLVFPGAARTIQAVNRILLRFRLYRNRLAVPLTSPVVVWAYNPRALEFVPRHWPVIYHCVDDLAAFPGVNKARFRDAEKAMARRANVSIASSRPLVQHLEELGARNVTYWPNPADVAAYLAASASAQARERPLVGFVGAIQTHKVDLRLIAECARLRPDWDFELVGPVGLGLRDTGSDRLALEALPSNVAVKRSLPREALPALLATYSAGIIPYHLNDYTASVFPMKVFEYLASGLPTVSTPLPSLVGEVEYVAFATTAVEFVAALDAAIKSGRRPGDPATVARQEYAESHSWANRTRDALSLLDELTGRQR